MVNLGANLAGKTADHQAIQRMSTPKSNFLSRVHFGHQAPQNTYGNLFQLCYRYSQTFKKNWDNDSQCRSSWDSDKIYRQNTVLDSLKSNVVKSNTTEY
ncbi:hypothetical protein BB560_005962 [Smittium megazygosporum]|uniref:Uncharacterized protein n=1 Tax=Smittium megazygosporum TaxID=133381 RepID=A0A2T9YP06_9FUNG|nr:hypothetical protein BB560_005962 [Smittium megazygosporum]